MHPGDPMSGSSAKGVSAPVIAQPVVLGLLLVLGGLTSVFATIYGNGNLAISLGPLLLLLILAVLLYAPIRVPLTVLIFLSLALDATDEGPFNSVLAPIGALIVINL